MGAAEDLRIKQIVDRVDELPTLPAVVYEVTEIINDPMSSTADVEAVMSNDPSLTAKVLKLANSAYYAIPGGVSSLARAIGYIGYDTVQQLVLSASIIDSVKIDSQGSFDPTQFWCHCMGVAMAGETIAKEMDLNGSSDIFTCGLVHDIGKLAIFLLLPEQFEQVRKTALEKDITFLQAEKELGHITHTEIGEILAQKWKLPAKIRNTIKYHHEANPEKRHGVSSEANTIIDIIHVANLFVHALKFGDSGHRKASGVPKAVIERLQLSPNQVKDLLGNIKLSLDNAEGFLKVIGVG